MKRCCSSELVPHNLLGSIPAGTGKPRQLQGRSRSARVDPRGYGETENLLSFVEVPVGRSPRVRGNRKVTLSQPNPLRSIPAGTGKPLVQLVLRPPEFWSGSASKNRTGPWPRRGPSVKPGAGVTEPQRRGVSPGSADPASHRPVRAEHGTTGSRFRPYRARTFGSGISRGSRRVATLLVAQPRAIRFDPYGVGDLATKPGQDFGIVVLVQLVPSRVDPRGYGETQEGATVADARNGRSPRVRGNRRVIDAPLGNPGSIPAGTGKPLGASLVLSTRWVDPRGYGETLIDAKLDGHIPRSIPAGTGKPPSKARLRLAMWVDPRGYGETYRRVYLPLEIQGRSPRVRGNRRWWWDRPPRLGSIPAGTGKPA